MRNDITIAVLVLISGLCLGLSLARADTITITILSASGGCPSALSCTHQFTEATNQFMAKLAADYGPKCQAQNLVGTPPVPTPCTAPQVFQWWAASVISGTVNDMASTEKAAAASTASSAINPLNPQ